MLVDRQLLHTVMEKLGQKPTQTMQAARETLPVETARMATFPELAELAKRQQETTRFQYGSKPGVQTAGAVGLGAGAGAFLGGALGGGKAVLPGAILGGFLTLIARFFFKDQFDQAFQWFNQTMQRPDAAQVFNKVKEDITAADKRTESFLEGFDVNEAGRHLEDYKKQLEASTKTTDERIKTYQQALATAEAKLGDPNMPPDQQTYWQNYQQKAQEGLQNAQSTQQRLADAALSVANAAAEQEERAPAQVPAPVVTPAAAPATTPAAEPAKPEPAAAPKKKTTGPMTPESATQPKGAEKKQQKEGIVGDLYGGLKAKLSSGSLETRRKLLRDKVPGAPGVERARTRGTLSPVEKALSWASPELYAKARHGVTSGMEAAEGAKKVVGQGQKAISGLQKGFQKYKTPMMMMAAMPLIMSMMKMFSGYGQQGQLANIAKALQQRGAQANPYMAQVAQANPYFQQGGAFRSHS